MQSARQYDLSLEDSRVTGGQRSRGSLGRDATRARAGDVGASSGARQLTDWEDEMLFMEAKEFVSKSKSLFKKDVDLDAFVDHLIAQGETQFRSFELLYFAFQEYCILNRRRGITRRALQNAWKMVGGVVSRPEKKGRRRLSRYSIARKEANSMESIAA